MLRSVYRNLFKNAIKYGGDKATLAFGAEQRDNDYRLHVFNTGEPLPPESRDKLFNEGYSESERGLGIGLSMTQTIIQAHGGEIDYQACEDGSDFVFTLPR
jgi:signal transduction histidine kinase